MPVVLGRFVTTYGAIGSVDVEVSSQQGGHRGGDILHQLLSFGSSYYNFRNRGFGMRNIGYATGYCERDEVDHHRYETSCRARRPIQIARRRALQMCRHIIHGRHLTIW